MHFEVHLHIHTLILLSHQLKLVRHFLYITSQNQTNSSSLKQDDEAEEPDTVTEMVVTNDSEQVKETADSKTQPLLNVSTAW